MVFAPSYVPHGIPMKYDGETITLNPAQEELATFYAAIPDDGKYSVIKYKYSSYYTCTVHI